MSLLRYAARAAGYDLIPRRKTREPLARMVKAMRRFAVDAVIDVGANRGQYATALRATGWHGPILSFEPIPEVHAALTAAAAKDPLWMVAPAMALADHDGTASLAVSAETDMTSLLPRTPVLENLSPSSKVVRSVEVAVRRLDGLAGLVDPCWRRIFLKLDVQGAEASVITGAQSLWPRIIGSQVELALLPLYQGEMSWRAMIDLLAARGMVPWQFIPGYFEPSLARELQMDGVFFKEDQMATSGMEMMT